MATGKMPYIDAGPEVIFKVGYYKEHPIIPDDMSDKAKSFILKCFEPDPEKRLTADQLLEEPFLTDPKESRKKPPTGLHSTNTQTASLLNNTATNKNGYFEFNRSASVPSGELLTNVNPQSNTLNNNHHVENQLTNGAKGTKIARFTSNEERNQENKNKNLKLNIKSANSQNRDHQNQNGFLNVSGYSTVDTDSNSPNILTPNSFDESPQLSRKRGTSSDIMCSPPVTDSTLNGGSEEQFFVVKKEGQRRATLYQIMSENSEQLCEAWFSGLEKVAGQCLEKSDLSLLLNGLRNCINGDNDDILYHCLTQVKNNQLEKGLQPKEAIKEIKNALYSVREPMNTILRTRNIKPHWIFSLDNLINNVVYKALGAFSKDDQYSSSDESDSDNRQVDYTYSSQSQDLRRLNLNTNRLSELGSFNSELWEKLIRQEIFLKNILIKSLKRKTMTSNEVELLNHPSIDYLINDDNSDRSFVIEPSTAQSDKSVSFSTVKRDEKLVEWLKSVGCDNFTIEKFVREELTYESVLNHMEKGHLQRLKLKLGVEIAVWNAIEQTREIEKQKQITNNQTESNKPTEK